MIQNILNWIFNIVGLIQHVKVRVHKAYLRPNNVPCYFVNVTNMSLKRHAEVTHIWFECDGKVNVINPMRPLPKRLRPEESWETWIEVDKLPSSLGDTVYTLARVRLSNGSTLKSQLNKDVPSEGYIPGAT